MRILLNVLYIRCCHFGWCQRGLYPASCELQKLLYLLFSVGSFLSYIYFPYMYVQSSTQLQPQVDSLQIFRAPCPCCALISGILLSNLGDLVSSNSVFSTSQGFWALLRFLLTTPPLGNSRPRAGAAVGITYFVFLLSWINVCVTFWPLPEIWCFTNILSSFLVV